MPIVGEVPQKPEGEEYRDPRPVSRWIKVGVECKKCGRRFDVDFYPYAPHPIRVRTLGVELAPHLRAILEEEFGPFPDLVPCEPPTHVSSCSKCTRRRVPREGDTFKKRGYRGRFKTIGSPDPDPENTYDREDQTLAEEYYKSRYGQEIDYANEQSSFREWLYKPEQLRHAEKVLDNLSLREAEQRWGVPRMTTSRGKKAIKALVRERGVAN